jgi:hypothetical protein
MNAIHLITPRKESGMWVFDDEQRGLLREPFVAGADDVIELASQSIPNAEQGFNLLFSASPFPTAQIRLDIKERGTNTSGNTYYCPELKLDAWLCPALYKYFDVAPDQIFAEFRAASVARPARSKTKTNK